MDSDSFAPRTASSPAEASMADSETPSTTPRKTSKKRSSSVRAAESDDDDTASVKKAKNDPKTKTTTAASRKRKPPGKQPLKAMHMGQSFELCQDHDKMLISWKEAGRTWDDIRKEWQRMTGDATATSTLPNRYSRLKSNFVIIKEEHNAILLEAKQEVEATYEREKWHLISKAMETKGADKYKPVELHRQYKKLLQMGAELKAERDGLIPPSPTPMPVPVRKRKGKKAVRDEEIGLDSEDEMEEY